jgi:hypothetical protein
MGDQMSLEKIAQNVTRPLHGKINVQLFPCVFRKAVQSKQSAISGSSSDFWARKFFLVVKHTTQQGCQIFLGPKYQNGEKYTKLPQNTPNCHKIFPTALK